MRYSAGRLAACVLFTFGLGVAAAHAQVFTSTLSGASENPAVVTTGSGTTTVTLNQAARTIRVQANFTGLIGNTTAAHLHCCSAPPTNAGVATTTPSLVGFPLGVQAGTFDQTYSLQNAASFNPAFIAANGATVAGAEAALVSGILAGQTYLNIHTATFGGGEIRGQLLVASSSVPIPTLTHGLLALLGGLLVAGTGFAWRRRQA